MKKQLLAVAACVIAMGLSECNATVTLTWSSGTTGRIYNENGIGSGNELTPAGGNTQPLVGCFLQVIYSVNGNIGLAVTDTSTGIATTDAANNIVVRTCWIGRGVAGAAGRFATAQYISSYPASSKFFLRAWNAPSPDLTTTGLATASIPAASGSLRYGNSLVYTAGDPAFNTLENADLSNIGSFATTLTPVPEPATMALFGLGAAAIALRRKLRS